MRPLCGNQHGGNWKLQGAEGDYARFPDWDEAPVVPNREAKRNGSQEAKRYLTLEALVWDENHTFRFSVNEIFGAVARLFLRLVFSRVIHEDQVMQILAADDGIRAHARPAAIQAFRADAAEVRALRLNHIRSALRTSAPHFVYPPYSCAASGSIMCAPQRDKIPRSSSPVESARNSYPASRK